jgi:V-type H+-transporting ATPase subunit E
LQTEHDFNLEKQMIVTNATLKLKQEYDRKKKDLQIEQLM